MSIISKSAPDPPVKVNADFSVPLSLLRLTATPPVSPLALMEFRLRTIATSNDASRKVLPLIVRAVTAPPEFEKKAWFAAPVDTIVSEVTEESLMSKVTGFAPLPTPVKVNIACPEEARPRMSIVLAPPKLFNAVAVLTPSNSIIFAPKAEPIEWSATAI